MGERPSIDPVDLSIQRQGRWSGFARWVYAIASGLAFLAVVATLVGLIVALAIGAMTISAGIGVTIALFTVLSVMSFAAAWIFWTFGIVTLLDLRTDGAFRASRSERWQRNQHRFSVIALSSLIVIPFVPILAVFD